MQEKGHLVSRLRKAGHTLEEVEDLVHDAYLEAMECLPLLDGILNLPAWINRVLTNRLIDLWRHNSASRRAGESDVQDQILREIIDGAGVNPLDGYIQDALVEALNTALKVLPPTQRYVLEAQVFEGKTFREISEVTGIPIDTLTARKRYAIKALSRALRAWIEL